MGWRGATITISGEAFTASEGSFAETTRHDLEVDFSEARAALPDLARRSGRFQVRMGRLIDGDYLIDGSVLVERKTIADFASSLADGRLFQQAARLARSPFRSIILIEGPRPLLMPDVDANALKGAAVSLALMWRLPLLHARDPEDSMRILSMMAQQSARAPGLIVRRGDRKPKRFTSRKLHILQGLPGVGPELARRLLVRFGSIERIVTADEQTLLEVRGVGPQTAARIRRVLK